MEIPTSLAAACLTQGLTEGEMISAYGAAYTLHATVPVAIWLVITSGSSRSAPLLPTDRK
jgi:hypothetical protein